MAAVLHDEGKEDILAQYIAAAGGDLRVRLFKNNVAPARDKNVAFYTQADFSGYADVTPSFGGEALNGDSDAEDDADPAVFTHNGGGTANTIYGWILFNTTTNKVLFGDTFAAPIVLASAGNYIAVTLPVICKAAA